MEFLERSFLDRESELLDVGLGLIFDHLIDEGKDVVALHTKKDKRRAWIAVGGRVGAGDTPWIDEVLAVVLSDVVLVRMSAHQNIAVKLSLYGGQGLHVSPGDHLMTMDDTDLEVVNLDDLCLGEALYLITVTADDMCLTLSCGEVLKPLNRLMENKAKGMSAQVVIKSSD